MSVGDTSFSPTAQFEPAAREMLDEAGGRVTSMGVNGEVVARLQKAFDGSVVAACGVAAILMLAAPDDRFELTGVVLVMLLAMFAHLLVTREFGGYLARRLINPAQAAMKAIAGIGLAAVAALAALSAIGLENAVVAVAAWWASASAILLIQRFAVSRLLRSYDDAGRLSKRVAVVGSGDVAREVIATLASARDGEIDLCGFFDDRADERTPTSITDCPNLGSVEDLVEFSRWFRIDIVVVALPLAADRRIYELLKQLWVIPADIRIGAAGSPLRLSRRVYSHLGGVPLLDAFARPLSGWNGLVKDVFDRIAAAALLIALAPVFAAVALMVKLDSPGPALFRQPRYGFNNQLIQIYKFRSMHHGDADRDASRLVTKGDPRVTRVGRFIRKTSLDELPQLVNVLKGELSLVGPRPHAVKASAADTLYDDVVEGYLARHRVKPGVTGWAQINGWRGETDTTEKIERRVEHDLYYINNWSLWLDFKILLRTPLALLAGENAY